MHTDSRPRRLTAANLAAIALAAIMLFLSACGDRDDPTPQPTPSGSSISVTSTGRSVGLASAAEDRLVITLSEGQAAVRQVAQLPVTKGEPLSDAEIAQIVARLPELAGEPEDQEDFRLPEDLLPPPRPGETVEEAFPPPAPEIVPDEVPTGPLEVLRYAPEGEIPLAPFVNVTFNQPMVALATLEALSEADVPVQIEPALSGTWRWLGTKTLSFEYDSDLIDRLPMATEYTVTIPADTRSATGGTLAEEVRWTFSTPPPRMTATYPSSSPQPLEPIFAIAFDQRIDPEAVLETIAVTAGGQRVAVKLATADQVSEDKEAQRLVDGAGEGRWLAFVAQEPLPADTSITVTVGPGTPSAEGPLVTEEAQSYGFRTYAPLRIERHECSWRYNDNCPPLSPFSIQFNNPLDVEAFDPSFIQIDPELPGASIDVAYSNITIRGATKGSTTYRVTVGAAVRDVFGQTLGEDARLSFKVGQAEPRLYGPDRPLITLDPASKDPVLSVYAINHPRLKLKVYQVQPADWPAFQNYLQNRYRRDNPPMPPGKLAIDEIVRLEAASDVLTEARIDLSKALDKGLGHVVVLIEPEKLRSQDEWYWNTFTAWVQVTQIGLDAIADYGEMVAWATALADGAPLEGVSIETYPGKEVATTGADGTARFALPNQDTHLVIARKGSDTAILSRSPYAWGDEPWRPEPVQDEIRWYVFDDRAMYRPGEEVHVKGWLRRVGGKQDGDVGLLGEALQSVQYTVVDATGNEVLKDSASANAYGGFDLSFTLPERVNLGYANLRLQAIGSLSNVPGWYQQHSHGFQIQEFRRPEFEVTARNETTGPYFASGSATVAVEAAYYAGGPLPNAEVTWQVNSSPGSYSPPNWPGFVFGKWRPWWFDYWPVYRGGYGESYWPYDEETIYETFAGTTDASGTHYLQLDFGALTSPQPYSVQAEATVMDVNRQAWAASTTLLVHPAELYVGLRSQRTFVERGQPLEIELIVTDLDGVPVPDRPIQVEAARLEWKFRQGEYRQEAVDVQTCTIGSGTEPVSCTFETPMGGQYQITATITDAQGRTNESQFTRWVSGAARPPSRDVEQEAATLIPDRDSYQPGDVAEILVQSPFSPAEGLLTVSRSGLLYTESFRVEDGTATLRVPIEEKHIPNLNVQVDLVGAAARTDDQGEPIEGIPPRPAYASGQLSLSIPPLQRTLSLQVTPREKALEPGGETTLDLLLTDASGEPVSGAELAVVVVDEAILALTNYQLADPVAAFYQSRSPGITTSYGRAYIILANPQDLTSDEGARQGLTVVETVVVEKEVMGVEEEPAMAPAPTASAEGARDSRGAEPEPIAVRADFNPLATFAPEVRTGADGRAEVPVSLPDNLTRYRIMVVAVAGENQFGSAEANLTARLPLMVRPSAPRFLNFGDQFELPIVVQNQTDEALSVDVVVQAANLVLTDVQGQRVTVPANDRVEVRFPATTDSPGTARFQAAAVAGSYADAAQVELPVYTPATTEAFATYGVVDEGAIAQPVSAPGDEVFVQFGGLDITTSSTALQALTDAVLYLVSYPFECSEQLASRILAVAALRDVLSAFSAEGLPSPEAMADAVERDIDLLKGLQNPDGGFATWARGRESIPYHTVHALHALVRARDMDFAVPQDMLSRALDYVRDVERHYPEWYGKETRQTISAYALYVRHLMGDGDPAKARKLIDEAGGSGGLTAALDSLPLEATAWLWQVLLDDPASAAEVEAIGRHINNRAVETAGAANFSTGYGDQAYLLLHSSRRADAVILEALIAAEPESDLIPKVVNGLLAHRTRGRWNNTQENVFVLLALDRYFETFEAQTPDFVARMWLGETYVGEHAYEGRTTERHETSIPMAFLAEAGGTQDLILSKDGTGRLYYRLGLRYAPTDLELDPLDMGFVVQRRYEAVDDPEDVTQDSDGVWHIRAGARVRVRLTMVANNRRYHVALVDPLPAGLEIVNPALAVSGDIPQDPEDQTSRRGWWWWGTWFEHQNMRDERAEAFSSLVWEGVYDYTYLARATTPGTFVVPPAKAEEMYAPEVFGRSSSDVVIVK